MTSRKQLELISMYTEMAQNGYDTVDKAHISTAFSDMEIRAFKEHVKVIFEKLKISSLLDYGCGGSNYEINNFHESLSAKEYFELDRVHLYEPARSIDQRVPCDATVCFDVLEHVYISDVARVIRELFALTKRVLIVNVACYAARATLPNGENAHITVRPPLWWKGVFDSIAPDYPGVSIQLWCSTGWRQVEGFPMFSGADWLESETFVVDI